MKPKRILTGRVTKIQKQKLIDKMNQNRALGCGQVGVPDSSKNNKQIWMSIAEELNSGGGALKTAEQWKRCWTDWKSSVKKQYGAIERFNAKTDNLTSSSAPKKLDELDAQIVQFFAKDVYEGDRKKEVGRFLLTKKIKIEVPAYEELLEEEQIDESFDDPSSSKSSQTPKTRNTSEFLSQLEEVKFTSPAQMDQLINKIDEMLQEQKKTNILLEELIKTKIKYRRCR